MRRHSSSLFPSCHESASQFSGFSATPTEQPQAAATAHAGTPHYGAFGDPAHGAATPEPHPNRPYVGGYMDPAGPHGGCETGPYEPTQQRGHAEQKQAAAAVKAAQRQDENVERAAYAAADRRYAGGNKFDLADKQTSL